MAEDVTIGENAEVGVGEYAESNDKKVYQFDLVTIGEPVIPDGVKIGRNTAISGVTTAEDYHGGELESGDYIIKGQVEYNESDRDCFTAGGNSKRMRELSNKSHRSDAYRRQHQCSVDFALSNMSNSHIQSVAVLTQYNSRS